MVSQLNVSVPTREIGYGVVQQISRTIGFSTPNIGTTDGVTLGKLPANAQIISCIVRITTGFNAATTNVLTVGTSSGSDADIVAAGDIDETTTGTVVVTRGCDLSFSADTSIFIKYTQTGTAATAGGAVVVLTYVVPATS